MEGKRQKGRDRVEREEKKYRGRDRGEDRRETIGRNIEREAMTSFMFIFNLQRRKIHTVLLYIYNNIQ
jgi:hypothetical protein